MKNYIAIMSRDDCVEQIVVGSVHNQLITFFDNSPHLCIVTEGIYEAEVSVTLVDDTPVTAAVRYQQACCHVGGLQYRLTGLVVAPGMLDVGFFVNCEALEDEQTLIGQYITITVLRLDLWCERQINIPFHYQVGTP